MMDGTARFPNLLSEIRLNTLTVRNRIISSRHGTRLADNHEVSDRLLAPRTAEEAVLEGLEAAAKL